jgi:rRNA-processing protein EBP2
MGKKSIRVEPDADEREQAADDAEYEAEKQAVEALRAEREAKQQSGNENTTKVTNYNKEGLISALENLETRTLPFLQNYRVDEFSLVLDNELDDIERETAFYNHAMEAVKAGYARLRSAGVPVVRPNDFFCEQVKSDAHMTRIKDRLLIEEKRMDAFDKRKNREQNRKFNKQLTEVKKQERSQGEQKVFKDVAQLRKGKKSDDTDAKLEKILNSQERPQQGKKRKGMDKKYGMGGRDKKRAKLNDKK